MGGELAMERGEVIVARQYFSIPGGYRRVPEGTHLRTQYHREPCTLTNGALDSCARAYNSGYKLAPYTSVIHASTNSTTVHNSKYCSGTMLVFVSEKN